MKKAIIRFVGEPGAAYHFLKLGPVNNPDPPEREFQGGDEVIVRIQSTALVSRWCNGQHKTFLRSWSWFESRLGRLHEEYPDGAADSDHRCAAVPDPPKRPIGIHADRCPGPGSSPGRDTDHALRV